MDCVKKVFNLVCNLQTFQANLKKGIMKALQMLDDDPILTIGEFVNESVVIEV